MDAETRRAKLIEMLAEPPFHQWLKPDLVEADAESGRVVIRLAARPEFRRNPTHPALHGGIVASLIDIAGHAAVAFRTGHGVPTIDLRVDYLRMAQGTLTAVAEPLRVGRTIGVVDVRVRDEDGSLVACGRGAFATTAG